jgi:outer membrane lipoprotein-sorting protein
MNRRTLLLAVAFVPLTGLPALAQALSLKDISAYINSIVTAETGFRQRNADGSRSEGRLIIQRPGRMRFEYAKPDRTLVLASGGQVAIFDAKSNQPPEQYPLKRTPLNLILAKKVDLGRARMVVDHGQEGEFTTVTARDPENPEYGTIKLFFSSNPIALREWIVTDEGGNRTQVTLGELQLGANYKPSTFSINVEIDKRK